jgi:hypothetical protein
MSAAGRKRKRAARRDPGQTTFRVEHLDERKEVMLTGATAMKQHQYPLRVVAGWTDAMPKPVQ